MKRETYIQIALSALILIILFKFVDFRLLFKSLGDLNVCLIIAAFALLPVSLFIRSVRWRLILNKDGLRVALKDLFLLTNVGIAMDMVIPGGSGDILKSYYGYKRLGIKEEMLSSSIIDKCVALLAVLILGVFSTYSYRLYPYLIGCMIGIAILSVLVFVPNFIQMKWTRKLSFSIKGRRFDVEKLINASSLSFKLKVITLLISIVGWAVTYFQLYIICLAFSIEVEFLYVLAVAPLFSLARLFPFTLNGLGTQEAVIIYLFGLINIGSTLSVLVSLTNRVVNFVIPAIIGIIVIHFGKSQINLLDKGIQDQGKKGVSFLGQRDKCTPQ